MVVDKIDKMNSDKMTLGKMIFGIMTSGKCYLAK